MLGEHEQDPIGLVAELHRPVRAEQPLVRPVDREIGERQVHAAIRFDRHDRRSGPRQRLSSCTVLPQPPARFDAKRIVERFWKSPSHDLSSARSGCAGPGGVDRLQRRRLRAGRSRRPTMEIRTSLFGLAASLYAMTAFAGTVAVMTVDGGAGFPVAGPGEYQLA